MNPLSRMRSSAKSRVSRELVRSDQGDNRFGLLIRPASVAHSASVILRRLAKVAARGCFGPVHAATEINPIQIQLEDFLFAEIVFDSLGQKDLQQLSAVCS